MNLVAYFQHLGTMRPRGIGKCTKSRDLPTHASIVLDYTTSLRHLPVMSERLSVNNLNMPYYSYIIKRHILLYIIRLIRSLYLYNSSVVSLYVGMCHFEQTLYKSIFLRLHIYIGIDWKPTCKQTTFFFLRPFFSGLRERKKNVLMWTTTFKIMECLHTYVD